MIQIGIQSEYLLTWPPETRTPTMEESSENKENIPPYSAYSAHPPRPTLPLSRPLPPRHPTVLAPALAAIPTPRPRSSATAVQFPSTPTTAASILSAGPTVSSSANNSTTPINNHSVSAASARSNPRSVFKPKIYKQQIYDKDNVKYFVQRAQAKTNSGI